jgi:hypothetical protein
MRVAGSSIMGPNYSLLREPVPVPHVIDCCQTAKPKKMQRMRMLVLVAAAVHCNAGLLKGWVSVEGAAAGGRR